MIPKQSKIRSPRNVALPFHIVNQRQFPERDRCIELLTAGADHLSMVSARRATDGNTVIQRLPHLIAWSRAQPMNDIAQSNAVRALNDAFRKSLRGGTVMMTAGIVALGDNTQARILAAIQAFDAFNADNDPWGEHDFGFVEIDGERIFFKLDYYDLNRAMHSDDPTDPSKTERVMTILLASEY